MYVHAGRRTFQSQITTHLLRFERTGGGSHVDTGIGRNRNFVLYLTAFRIRAGKQVRININPIAVLYLINFNFIGMQNRSNHHSIGSGGFHRDGAIRIGHRYARPRMDREAVFFVGLARGKSGRSDNDHDQH